MIVEIVSLGVVNPIEIESSDYLLKTASILIRAKPSRVTSRADFSLQALNLQ